jgi:hypothetical protein
LEIQAKIRQIRRAPASMVQQTIETDREVLAAMIVQLRQAQHVAGVLEINGNPIFEQESNDLCDDIINEPITESDTRPATLPALSRAFDQDDRMDLDYQPAPVPSIGPLQVEDLILSIPSNGNVRLIHSDLERSLRITLAEHHLIQIRSLIVEKSFQFSHVIRVSPRKSVTTRSRAAIKKINTKIAFHCRLYSKSRDHFVSLGADEATKSRLRILSPGDVKSSGAIVNPNQPGSTQLKLSWIWQSSGRHRWGLTTDPAHRARAGAVS